MKLPQNTLRIDIVQHGSKVPLHLVLPAQTTAKLLEKFDFDLKTISENVQVVNNNRIIVVGSYGSASPS